MKKLLVTLMFSVIFVGILLANFNLFQPARADEGCVKSGKQMSASDGTLICDCTATGTPGCTCILPDDRCKPNND
jgi:hypothetical protein